MQEVQYPFFGLQEVQVDEQALQEVEAVVVVYFIAGHVKQEDAVPPVK